MLRDIFRRSGKGRGVRMRARRHVPVAAMMLYYGVLIAVGLLLIRFLPGAEDVITAPIAPSSMSDIFGAGDASTVPQPIPESPWGGPFGRLALTLFAVLGAVVLALPVAGIYMHTRRLRYDPSLVQTIIVLPIVVAGVVLVVKNSLALAFALAGIVAGVRFRQKLNEPKDAVYVLLSLGLGLAAAVQALDVALAVSLAFNVVVLALWRYEPGTLNPHAVLAMGDTGLLEAALPVNMAIAREVAGDMETDGILVVHAPDAAEARRALDMTLAGLAKEWRYSRPVSSVGNLVRFDVIMRLSGSTDPVELVAELEERWAAQIAAAQYIAYRTRPGEDDDDD